MSESGFLSILWLGDSRRDEFREARSCLDRFGRVTEAPSVDEAVALLAATEVLPALIVIAQSYPGAFSIESLDRLRREAPLARVIGLLGSWCEGEARTGYPWPATIRLYWHQWTPQCSRELEALLADEESAWSLPGTATDEERLQAATRRPQRRRDGLIAICAPRFEVYDWLMSACRRLGYSTVWLKPDEPVRVEGAVAALFDTSATGNSAMARLRRLHDHLGPGVPILAMLDFPRIEDQQRALAAGASAVLSKPLLVDDLFWQLDQLTET